MSDIGMHLLRCEKRWREKRRMGRKRSGESTTEEGESKRD